MGGSLEISFPMHPYKRFYVYCEPGIVGPRRGKLTLLAAFADFSLLVFMLSWYVEPTLDFKAKCRFYIRGG